jgi:hypothetical protein
LVWNITYIFFSICTVPVPFAYVCGCKWHPATGRNHLKMSVSPFIWFFSFDFFIWFWCWWLSRRGSRADEHESWSVPPGSTASGAFRCCVLNCGGRRASWPCSAGGGGLQRLAKATERRRATWTAEGGGVQEGATERRRAAAGRRGREGGRDSLRAAASLASRVALESRPTGGFQKNVIRWEGGRVYVLISLISFSNRWMGIGWL